MFRILFSLFICLFVDGSTQKSITSKRMILVISMYASCVLHFINDIHICYTCIIIRYIPMLLLQQGIMDKHKKEERIKFPTTKFTLTETKQEKKTVINKSLTSSSTYCKVICCAFNVTNKSDSSKDVIIRVADAF